MVAIKLHALGGVCVEEMYVHAMLCFELNMSYNGMQAEHCCDCVCVCVCVC